MSPSALAILSDDELLRRLAELLRDSRRVEADLVEHLAEVDARRLYAREAAPSLFVYCTEGLHLSEAEAYLRIAAARVARRHPAILALLREGRLHLSGIALLGPHLTPANEVRLLAQCVNKTKRAIEEVLAALEPRPDAPSHIRRLPLRTPSQQSDPRRANPAATAPSAPLDAVGRPTAECGAGSATQPPELRPDGVANRLITSVGSRTIEPLGADRYKVQFTASRELRDKLERLRSLSRAAVPDGDLAALIEIAVTEKLERIEARRFGAARRLLTTGRPLTEGADRRAAADSRRVPAAVRRAVLLRDGRRCGFVDAGGRRCSERHDLEYHHRRPWAMGGGHDPANIGLLCRAHNAWMAEQDYGRRGPPGDPSAA